MRIFFRSQPVHKGRLLLFIFFTLTCLWVVIFSEIPLMSARHPAHAHIASVKWILLPHALCASIAFLTGPFQFSSYLRKKNLKLHRLLGKIYVGGVYLSAIFVFVLITREWPTPANLIRLNIANAIQASLWIGTTTMAWATARRGQIQVHQLWISRSYGITSSFFLSRMLNPWPAYYRLSFDDFAYVLYILIIAALFIPDLMVQWKTIFPKKRTRPGGSS